MSSYRFFCPQSYERLFWYFFHQNTRSYFFVVFFLLFFIEFLLFVCFFPLTASFVHSRTSACSGSTVSTSCSTDMCMRKLTGCSRLHWEPRDPKCLFCRYERSNPVYNLTLNDCGTVHIVVGDGGNNVSVQNKPSLKVISNHLHL